MRVPGCEKERQAELFCREAPREWPGYSLKKAAQNHRHYDTDIRDADAISSIFREYSKDISLIIHAAAQPSHDWAASKPLVDFTVNANGTSVLLEATRLFAPHAVFIYMSTNKVYGDRPNSLPLLELGTRWQIDPDHPYAAAGIPATMSLDHTR